MGGSYSDLNVYFNYKSRSFRNSYYEVVTRQKNFDECCNFVVFTHNIIFTNIANPLNYNVLLYDGSSDKHKGNYFFGYYYPGNDKEVIQEVRSYYSVLAPNLPLVISFVTKGGQNYNCLSRDLKNARWDRAYNITAYTIKKSLKDHLDDEFKKLLFNRKIRLRIGKEKKEISGDKQELGDYENYRFIFLPVGNDSILGRECLFAIDFYSNKPIAPGDPDPNKPEYCVRAEQKDSSHKHEVKIEHKNKIDEYYLLPFDGQLYDGIMVYLARENGKPPKTLCKQNEDNNNTALLLEFIDSCKSKTHIKRKDKEGFWWAEEKVDYKNDAELLEKLREIKKKLDSNVVTVILDKKVTYNGVQAFKSMIDKKAYNKYTHEYKDAKKPNLLFERKDPKIGSNSLSEITAKIVEVYYLKAKDAIVDDAQPFLIVFYEKESPSEIKKAYHFKNSDKFEEWIEFNGGKTEGLEKKLEKIEENLKCIADLKLLRYMAYQILIGEDPKTTKPKDEETPQRPPEQQPSPTTEPLNIPLIAGCTVGGVVFVGSSAVGYGIYWYNTTIKLLT